MDLQELTAFIIEKGNNRFPDPDAVAKAIQKAARSSYRLPKTVNDSVNQVLSISDVYKRQGVHGEGFDYIFSYAQGGLESIVKNGYEWLYRGPKPTFWRALTDNDRGSKFHIKSGSWLSADIDVYKRQLQDHTVV